jgi:arylsulfatase A-like enzyme/Flp pilus assembly protein TadD
MARRPLLLLVCLALTLSCHRAIPRASNRIPVILITIDTLRSDHLPAYGYHDVDTPAIDAFRRDAVLFERAYSHVPLTLPSHTTMFTGRLPADNGVRDNIGFHLDEKIPTLASLLKANGYATGAAVSAYVLRRESGISRGFDFYDDNIDPANSGGNVGRVQRKGNETAAIAEKWIGDHASQPLFFFLHLYEPHSPYDPPEPYRSKYRLPYDGEIASADAIVGDFFAFLKKQGLYDQSLIILLSDHGEGLGDHKEQEHGIFLYREALQVPLIVKLPGSGMRGATLATPVELIDVFPTITAMTATAAQSKGVSLLDVIDGKSPHRQIYSESLFPKFHYGWSDLHSLIDGERHYIQAPRPELYDLAGDSAEKHNILSEDRRSYTLMRAAIAPLIHRDAAPSAVSDEERQKLAALGYIGSTVAGSDENLPDPKDRVGTSEDLRRAFELHSAGKAAEALPILQKLVRENPRMLDVWDIMARDLDTLGRTDEAIEAAKEGLKLSPNTTHLALIVARLSLDAGRLDDAQKHAELAVRDEPSSAHDLLARIALARNDYKTAEHEAGLALQYRDRASALLTLARVELAQKQYDLALDHCNRAVAFLESRKGTAVSGLWFTRGDILARMGRYPEAEESFRKEIELFPRDPQPYKNLILLYVTEGRNDEATKLVFQLIEKSPTPPAYAAVSATLHTIGDENGARYWRAEGLRKFPGNPSLR